MNRNNIFSFDIFDTCLIRSCGNPHNVFKILAYEILGPNSSKELREDFTLERIKAEKTARESSSTEEITIWDIYDKFEISYFTEKSKNEILKKEIEIEKNILRPVKDIKDKIHSLRKKNNLIIFISDMYLPTFVLKDILIKYGFYKSKDLIFVSSDLNLTKRTGNIYKYLIEKHKVQYKNWIHYGDNYYSDYKIPRRLNIKTKLITHTLSYYENLLLKYEIDTNSLAKISATISKCIILSKEKNKLINIAADLIAPLYVSYIYNILRKAQEEGIKKLFFLSRDGYILKFIADNLQKYFFKELKLNYLYVSRGSLYFPSEEFKSIKELSEFLKKFFANAKNKINLLKDYINSNLIESIINEIKLNTKNLSDNQIFNEIIKNESYLKSIKLYLEEQNLYLIQYFIQEGLADKNIKTGIVDIRGRRQSQKAINKILNKYGYPRAFGFYYEVIERRIFDYESYYYTSIFRENLLYNGEANILENSANIMESYFSAAPHNRVTNYYRNIDDEKVKFNMMDYNIDKNLIDIVNTNKSVLCEYIDLYYINKLFYYNDDLLNISTSLYYSFIKDPKRSYLYPLSLIYGGNSEHNRVPLITKNLNLLKLINSSWLYGSIFYSFPYPFNKIIWKIYNYLKKIIKILKNLKENLCTK